MERLKHKLVWRVVVGTVILLVITNLKAIPANTYALEVPAESIQEVRIDLSDSKAVMDYVEGEAIKSGVDPAMALFILNGETTLRPEVLSGIVLGDTHLTCLAKASPNYGRKMRARGAWQFNDCYYPEITDEQAFDLETSTALAMPIMKKNPERWSTYKSWLQRKK